MTQSKKARGAGGATRPKLMSSPGSMGGAGPAFEVQVQAAFVALMVTGGYAPGMPTWPIVEVKLQTRILGNETDDCMVTVEHPGCGTPVGGNPC